MWLTLRFYETFLWALSSWKTLLIEKPPEKLHEMSSSIQQLPHESIVQRKFRIESTARSALCFNAPKLTSHNAEFIVTLSCWSLLHVAENSHPVDDTGERILVQWEMDEDTTKKNKVEGWFAKITKKIVFQTNYLSSNL